MTAPRVLALAATGVAFVQSPRYLAETIADAVDARMTDVRDEQLFWRSVLRTYELRPSELAPLQARVAHKYCRNLDIWGALPGLRTAYRLLLVYSGPPAILACWREEYRVVATFDAVIEAADWGLVSRDAALYAHVADAAGATPDECRVVDSTAAGIAAAEAAGVPAYRYGTAYGLRLWLRGSDGP